MSTTFLRAGYGRVVAFALMALCAAACDPVASDARSALGGEASGVRTGPLHRPGQPCLVCHDGKLGDPVEFSVAGTIFVNETTRDPLPDAEVTFVPADGVPRVFTTNAAGNFYVSASEYAPVYPAHVSVTYQGTTTTMQSRIGRNGACGSCHVDPAGPDSPGHVYFTAPDGGVP